MENIDTEERRLNISTSTNTNNMIEIAICDNGGGMSPEIFERIFNPFFTTKPNGLGIGLSISYSIIEAHNGNIWATANPDRGSTFKFTLPITHTNSV